MPLLSNDCVVRGDIFYNGFELWRSAYGAATQAVETTSIERDAIRVGGEADAQSFRSLKLGTPKTLQASTRLVQLPRSLRSVRGAQSFFLLRQPLFQSSNAQAQVFLAKSETHVSTPGIDSLVHRVRKRAQVVGIFLGPLDLT